MLKIVIARSFIKSRPRHSTFPWVLSRRYFSRYCFQPNLAYHLSGRFHAFAGSVLSSLELSVHAWRVFLIPSMFRPFHLFPTHCSVAQSNWHWKFWISLFQWPALPIIIIVCVYTGWSKRLCVPDDYSTKRAKIFSTVSITYHDNIVRIRDNRWR
jgi:hypothetical protein